MGQRPLRAGPIKAKKPRVFELVSDRIRAELAAGRIGPGDRLPSERDLAQQLGVSRSAVREALRSLEMSGVLTLGMGAHGGAYIREGGPDGLSRSLHDLMFLSNVEFDRLVEVRSALLQLAVRSACERATPSDIVALIENVDELEEVYAREGMVPAIVTLGRYYELLGVAAHNDVLAFLIASLTSTVTTLLRQADLHITPEFVASRRRVIELIRERDIQAAEKEMADHLEMAVRYLARRRQTQSDA